MKKDEELLQIALANPDFLCESGSYLYGMATPTSDYDLRGFVAPPFPYLIGVKKFDSQEMEGDTKIYSILAFIRLVLKGDPQCSELFFAPTEHIKIVTPLGKVIMELKEHIISNAIYGRIMGYSTGEWRKAMAVKLVSTRFNKSKKEVINDVRSHWQLKKEKIDQIIDILNSVDEKKCISSMTGLGAKRKADIEKYGFCRKSAAHSIRLVQQLTELMETGTMTFPRPNAQELLDIRAGKYTKEELEVLHDEVVKKAEEMRPKSVLRDKPDVKKVWKLYMEAVAGVINRDEKFLSMLPVDLAID
ncbi:MAG: DNA polymerase beta superfamily protein [Candidatus Asgardarchaeia archaeon]